MSKPTVLVLDDDEDNVLILEVALASAGFDVRMARSCAEARTILAKVSFDALVTDFALGDGDALALAAELGERRPKVAVLVTGYSSAADRARTHEAGFDAHLVKPIALKDLEEALRRGLAKDAL